MDWVRMTISGCGEGDEEELLLIELVVEAGELRADGMRPGWACGEDMVNVKSSKFDPSLETAFSAKIDEVVVLSSRSPQQHGNLYMKEPGKLE